jgi:hypothetical protein
MITMDELVLNALAKYKELLQKSIDKNPARKKEKEDLFKLVEEKEKIIKKEITE